MDRYQKVHAGFSLIEVLVALVVAAIALLALASAQIKTLQFSLDSLRYTVATVEASNIHERIWPNLCKYQQGTEPTIAELTSEVANAGIYQYQLPSDFVFSNSPYTGVAGTVPTAPADFVLTVSWSDAKQKDFNQVQLSSSFPWLRNGNPDGCL